MASKSVFYVLVLLLLFLSFVVAKERHPPPVLLANVYDNDIDVSQYWISEKYDGVRAYWDGSQFISRQGNIYHAPPWFIAKFPKIPLDGELWMGRGQF